MLSEKIKAYRKVKGLTQEELASKLNVVRQTVSKWEKGLSVPDSQMLLLLAETLDVSVAVLLAESDLPEGEPLAEENAEVPNAQSAGSAEKGRRLRCAVLGIACGVAATVLLWELVAWCLCLLRVGTIPDPGAIGVIGGADGPTAIFVASTTVDIPTVLLAVVVLVLSVIGLRKSR